MTTFEITVTCERCQESTTFRGLENMEAPKAWVEAHLDDGCPAPPLVAVAGPHVGEGRTP